MFGTIKVILEKCRQQGTCGSCAAHISLIQEDEIFSFGDVFDPSSASLALSRKVVGIEDMVLRVQRRD